MAPYTPVFFGNENRFAEPLRLPNCPHKAAEKAACGFWEDLAYLQNEIDSLDAWAGAHDRAAVAGEARPTAAAEIDSLRPQLRDLTATLGLMVRRAREIAA